MKVVYIMLAALALWSTWGAVEASTYGTGRELLATCSKSSKKNYYGTKYLLEELDITGKNGHSSCCWYCRKTCGCKKWDYVDYGKTEICKLYESKARWKTWKGCKGCKHVSGIALNK